MTEAFSRKLSPAELAAIAKRRADAQEEVSRLCRGKRTWTMCIPVRPDDSDIVISASLRDINALLDHIAAMEADRAEAR